MARAPQRVAVIDVGSNSTRLLVADVADGEVARVERQSRVTRLGRGVDLTGQLSAEAIEATCEAIGDYAELCERLEVGATTTIATSAVRDASNGDAFVAELRERFALAARVLDGSEEARLTYLGATHERPPAEPTLVIDIGGGSTELIVGHDGGIDFEHSMQVGVVRHTERHIAGDPPTAAELEELAADVRGSRAAAVPADQASRVAAGIAVAGTPTSLAAVELELEPYDPERVHGQVLTLEAIQRLLSLFASRPLPERMEIVGLHADRAPTIIAGVVVLV
ncbi:MAG TPA: Ppx/GppA phosphatase family protein, partial [Solirubrobacterales bacterium]|nr:Ppx/GppA phosphatase family protein [Solirubrobacterales bacterium]